jgi:hypothetical protein
VGLIFVHALVNPELSNSYFVFCEVKVLWLKIFFMSIVLGEAKVITMSELKRSVLSGFSSQQRIQIIDRKVINRYDHHTTPPLTVLFS